MMLPEFAAARLSWSRWHEAPAAEADQRATGRRWRWTLLWERVWDEWLEKQAVVGSLDEFAQGSKLFWKPLRPLLNDPAPYDLTIESEWLDALAAGPAALSAWPAVVTRTWAQMQAVIAVPTLEPAAKVKASPKQKPVRGKTSSTPKPVPTTVQKPARGIPARRSATTTGDAVADARLAQWRQTLRDEGLSKSYSGNLRRYVILAANAAGIAPEKLAPTDDQWDSTTRMAIERYHQWLGATSTQEGS